MTGMFRTVLDVDTDQDLLKHRAYGVIEVCNQRLKAIHLRPYPKLISVAEIQWSKLWKKQVSGHSVKDRVLLYYNQPMLHRNFLALKYFVSDHQSTLSSIAVSLSVLDFIAQIKRTDAIVTQITNDRIQDRHLQHFGWEEHLLESRGRHWIKRFYGEYPSTYLFQEIGNTKKHMDPTPRQESKPEISIPVVVAPHTDVDSTHVRVH